MLTLATTAIVAVSIKAQISADRTTIARGTDRSTARNPRATQATIGIGLTTTDLRISPQVGRITLPVIAGVVAAINQEDVAGYSNDLKRQKWSGVVIHNDGPRY